MESEPGVRGDRVAAGRVPRISRLLALAIKLEGSGRVVENCGIRRRGPAGKISRHACRRFWGWGMAPRIQEKLLFLPQRVSGREQSLRRGCADRAGRRLGRAGEAVCAAADRRGGARGVDPRAAAKIDSGMRQGGRQEGSGITWRP
jgi:hypothetical protein